MKTVFPTHELAHVWAHQTQAEGRSPSNMSFRGKNFYSYRTVIAEHLPDGSVAVSTRRYSPTTTKHQWKVRQAVSHMVVHEVEYIAQVSEMLQVCNARIVGLIARAATARTKRLGYLAQAKTCADNLNGYLAAIGSDARVDTPMADDQELADIAKHLKLERAKAVASDKAREEAEAVLVKEEVAVWLAGGELSWKVMQSSVTVLRVNNSTVETSQGASVPLESALKMYGTLSKCTTAHQRRRLHGIKIGAYAINSCSAETLTVGCHRIPMSEIKRIADSLGATA